MRMRVGKVTQVFPRTGKIKVVYEDENNASLQLSMLTMNQEYLMPQVGDKVVTMHMENGSSKGFVFGTYYGGGMQPKANSGYRKDFGSGAYATCLSGAYRLSAKEVQISSAASSKDEDSGEEVADVYLKITEDEAELKAVAKIVITSDAGAYLILDSKSELNAVSLLIDADDLTLKCSYGEETFENILKRIERIEDALGLMHTI